MKIFNQSTRNKSELYRLYFLLLKVTYVISAIVLIKSTFNYFDLFSSFIAVMGLSLLGSQFAGVIYAEKLIEKKNLLGFMLALLLTALTLVSVAFPVAVFGLFALLNREFREAHLEVVPDWLDACFRQVDQTVNSLKGR